MKIGTVEQKITREYFSVGVKMRPPDLAAGETISKASATVSPAGMTILGPCLIVGAEATTILVGGTAGVTYTVEMIVDTSGGNRFIYTIDVIMTGA